MTEPWPEWWHYDLVLSPHLTKRMQDRDFSEVDLRTMLDDAERLTASVVPGRFLITTRFQRDRWEVVVEPDEVERILIVVTAYRIE